MNMYTFFYGINSVLLIIGILHILRKIGPNHFVGIRIGKTLGNEAFWYDAHVFAGWSMVVTSIMSVVVLLAFSLYHQHLSPSFPAEMVGAGCATALLFLGDAIIPLVYVLRMPDDGSVSCSVTISETLRSNYAVAVYMLLSVAMMVAALPGALGRVAPNGSYGFRTAKTLSSETLWYAANSFAGWATVIAGCVTIMGLLVLRYGLLGRLRTNGYAYLMMYLVPTLAGIVISLGYVYWYL